MSALAEGSLEALKLALWLWGSCVVSATPWVEKERGRERERETEMLLWLSGSEVVAAKACSSGAEGDSIISETNVVECQFGWGDWNLLFILNVTKCAICIQLQHLLTWIKIMAGKLLHMLVTRCLLLWCQRKAKPIAQSMWVLQGNTVYVPTRQYVLKWAYRFVLICSSFKHACSLCLYAYNNSESTSPTVCSKEPRGTVSYCIRIWVLVNHAVNGSTVNPCLQQ